MAKTLYIMCGAPGSGKTTWVREHAEPGVSAHISRDRIRFNLLTNDDDYFKYEKVVFKTFVHQIEQALNSPWIKEVYADATHMTVNSRKKLLNALVNVDFSKVNVVPVILMPKLETCIGRNSHRVGRAKVPDSAIEKMYESYQDPVRDGFAYAEYLDFGEGEC